MQRTNQPRHSRASRLREETIMRQVLPEEEAAETPRRGGLIGPMAPNRERLPPTWSIIFMILEGLNRVLESTTG